MSIIDSKTVEGTDLTAFDSDGCDVHVSRDGVRVYGDAFEIDVHSDSRAVNLYVKRNERNAGNIRFTEGSYQAVASSLERFAERNGITYERNDF